MVIHYVCVCEFFFSFDFFQLNTFIYFIHIFIKQTVKTAMEKEDWEI